MSDEKIIAQFAKTLHDAYIRSGPYPSKEWDQLDEQERRLVTAIYDEVFKSLVPAVIGEVSEGTPGQVLLTSNEKNVRIEFGKPMAWIAFEKADGIQFAIAILQKCGVPVNITFNPPAAPAEGAVPNG